MLCPAAGFAGSMVNFGRGLAISCGLLAGHETMNWAAKGVNGYHNVSHATLKYSHAKEYTPSTGSGVSKDPSHGEPLRTADAAQAAWRDSTAKMD